MVGEVVETVESDIEIPFSIGNVWLNGTIRRGEPTRKVSETVGKASRKVTGTVRMTTGKSPEGAEWTNADPMTGNLTPKIGSIAVWCVKSRQNIRVVYVQLYLKGGCVPSAPAGPKPPGGPQNFWGVAVSHWAACVASPYDLRVMGGRMEVGNVCERVAKLAA